MATAGDWVAAGARGVALFLGVFTVVNVVGGWLHPGFDANEWWIDLRPAPAGVGQLVLLSGAVALLGYAGWSGMKGWWRVAAAVACMVLLAVAVENGVAFYVLLGKGVIVTGCPVPFSAVVAGALGVVTADLVRKPRAMTRWGWAVMGVVFAGCVVGFPLAQMACFGKTDYRRPADVAVVFGARVFADGRLSDAAAERTEEAVRLYKAGLVKRIMMSGGPGDGRWTEAERMRDYAVELGVPREAIEVDNRGFHSDATVANTVAMARERGYRRVLAVSHAYHLPRVKMAFERDVRGAGGGMEVFTVPVHSERALAHLPRYILREVAALWAYYLRG